MAGSSKTNITVEGRELTISNLEKVLYPEVGFTKAGVVDYYARIAPAMLPHLARRAVTMVRWPDGVDGPSFFEKRCPSHAPDWVHTAAIDPDRAGPLIACVVDDKATLVWMANLAALELHTLQATVDDPEHPTSVVVDLDPGPPAGVLDCCRVALDLKAMLDRLGLTSVVKTSGGKGLHLAVPATGATAETTKTFARARSAPRQARPRAGHDRDGARRATRARLRRLEPERPAQDDRVRLLAAGAAASVRVDAAELERGV